MLDFSLSHQFFCYHRFGATGARFLGKSLISTLPCEEVEEDSRMGRTIGLFKTIRDTKGTFHAKMGTVKDRNGRDLTEAVGVKKRWQEYTEEVCKKIFTTKIITMM